MASLTMMLFRDGPGDGGDDLAAILGDIVQRDAERYALAEVDVQDRPALAERYNVRVTPTILLLKDGDIVDRVVGTPTRILLHNLIDTRTTPGANAAAF